MNKIDLQKPVTISGNNTPLSNTAWNLDWNLLRTFMVIVEKGSITNAAHFLNQKQPTLSNALKRLEVSLSCQLAERGPRSFFLTQQGHALYEECVNIFGTIGRLPNILAAESEEVEGHVKLVMASHVMTPLLDTTLKDFHEKNPKATISISIQSSHAAVQSVLAKEASLGICLLREQRTDFESTLFYREYFGFFCGPTHPLFGVEGLTLDDLRGLRRVSFSTDQLGDLLHTVAVLRGQAHLGDAVTGMSNNLEEVRRMIMAGLGIGALPIHVVERDILNKRLWRLPPYKNPPEIDIYIINNPHSKLNSAEKLFLKTLTDLVAATPLAHRIYG